MIHMMGTLISTPHAASPFPLVYHGTNLLPIFYQSSTNLLLVVVSPRRTLARGSGEGTHETRLDTTHVTVFSHDHGHDS